MFCEVSIHVAQGNLDHGKCPFITSLTTGGIIYLCWDLQVKEDAELYILCSRDIIPLYIVHNYNIYNYIIKQWQSYVLYNGYQTGIYDERDQ